MQKLTRYLSSIDLFKHRTPAQSNSNNDLVYKPNSSHSIPHSIFKFHVPSATVFHSHSIFPAHCRRFKGHSIGWPVLSRLGSAVNAPLCTVAGRSEGAAEMRGAETVSVGPPAAINISPRPERCEDPSDWFFWISGPARKHETVGHRECRILSPQRTLLRVTGRNQHINCARYTGGGRRGASESGPARIPRGNTNVRPAG